MSNNILPFRVSHSRLNENNRNNVTCNTANCLLPNRPIVQQKSNFPSALPSDFRPNATTIDTNYLNVKKIASICNLRCKSLTVDNNSNGPTDILFRDIPSNNGDGLSYLLVDSDGKIFKADSLISKKPKTFNPNLNMNYQNTTPQDMINIHDTNLSNNFY